MSNTGGERAAAQEVCEDITERLERLEIRQERQGKLLVIHDARLRELGTLFRVLQVSTRHTHYGVFQGVETSWKDKTKAYYEERKETGRTRKIGSKHLLLASKVLEMLWSDGNTRKEVKELLQKRYEGKDTSTTDFLGTDVKLMKWKNTRDGKSGILEFKLTEALTTVEEELIRLMVAGGATELQGPAPKGTMIREEEEQLTGTWKRT